MESVLIKAIGLTLVVCVIALIMKLISSTAKGISKTLPEKYRDGKIAPQVTEHHVAPNYAQDLDKEMEEAGVDNLHDLEEYRERKILKTTPPTESK